MADSVVEADAVQKSGGLYDGVNRSAHEHHWSLQQLVSGDALQQSVLDSELDTDQQFKNK
jgi:hypothetical protein